MVKKIPPILVCDDEKNMRRLLKDILGASGYQVEVAENGRVALEMIQANNGNYALLITDLSMPEMDGYELIQQIRALGFGFSVVVMTAHATVENAVQTMRSGAVDFIIKPFGIEQIRTAVSRTLDTQLLMENASLAKPRVADDEAGEFHIIGKSTRLQQIFRLISRISSLDTSVLIQGESGTGKELVAQAIHFNGNRKDKPFVAVNCAALPESLLESEFFGHERGAFTGAHALQKGKFELADGGTLFLDEIGEMPLALQAKMLRVLQEKKIQRVGGEKEIRVDVRVIAATNRDLSRDVDQKLFRQDLFYRLNVLLIELPPLRDRRDDIPELVYHFINQFVEKHQLLPISVHPDLMKRIQNAPWRGNIRELQNSVEKAVIMGDAEMILPDGGLRFSLEPEGVEEHTPLPKEDGLEEGSPTDAIYPLRLGRGDDIYDLSHVAQEAERRAILRAILLCNNNKAEAAKRLNISRKTLFNKINELKLRDLLNLSEDTPGADHGMEGEA
ncbi:MAG: sigma-54 dependent transcriptional regulator [Candidatus Sumerlaeia bacterium]|nr:sigma-54 dependent transcriptional regulator [Candidatus Sumerlaeia bacterium]